MAPIIVFVDQRRFKVIETYKKYFEEKKAFDEKTAIEVNKIEIIRNSGISETVVNPLLYPKILKHVPLTNRWYWSVEGYRSYKIYQMFLLAVLTIIGFITLGIFILVYVKTRAIIG